MTSREASNTVICSIGRREAKSAVIVPGLPYPMSSSVLAFSVVCVRCGRR